MLSTLRVIPRLCSPENGIVAITSKALAKCSTIPCLQTRQLHQDRNTAPEIQDYEPYSKLPYYDGKKGHLIYVGNMTKIVKGIKMFSISTSLVSIGSIPLIRTAVEESMTKAGVMGSISTVIFFTPFLLHFVTRKYVTDIYFNAETEVFTLATKSLLLRRKEVKFHASDVEIPFVGGAVVTHRVKKKPYFIERELFFNKDVYIKMVGYDKPFEDPFDKEYALKDKAQHEEIESKTDKKTDEDFGLFSSEKTESEKHTVEGGQKQESDTSEASEKSGKKKFGLFN